MATGGPPVTWRALVALALFGVILAVGMAEAGLRAFGFEYHTFPTVQFGWPQPTEIQNVYVPDRDLFWVTRDYQAKLAEARRSAPALIFMGDSCTEFGTWPRLTLEALATHAPPLSHGVSLAVGGWSSEQGLRQLRRDVLPLHPHVIVVYYGWNDHWAAFGAPDADAHVGAVSFWLSQHLRLMQLWVKSRLAGGGALSDVETLRVPPDRYLQNLETIARLAHSAGIRVVFITAATSHKRGQEPSYLAFRHLHHLEQLIPLHQQYVQLTRDAAIATGAEVCDLAEALKHRPGPIAQYFGHDGIHFNDAGSKAVAEILTAGLAASPDGASRPR